MKKDSLYYIMDYSGNYYRTDKSDQLITASEKDATVFTFTQANSRIGTGKKAAFYCMIPIEEKNESEEHMSPIKELTYDEVCEQVEKNALSYDLSEILLKIEDENCNVTQGYKVFKKLKELRLEKKAKIEELHCLYALTDYIDCDALADTCEDNLAEVEEIMEVKETEDLDNNQVKDDMCSKVG